MQRNLLNYNFIYIIILIFINSNVIHGQSTQNKINYNKLSKEIISATQHAWKGYKKYAWGYDALLPLSKKGKNWYKKSMLLTPVDAYDTFIMMGLKKEAKEAKQLILDSLRFDVDQEIQVFEITIRVLGGLLSAYELDGSPQFLSLAIDLTNRMMPAFETSTGIPYRFVNLVTKQKSGNINNPAEIGTLLLEFGKLSLLSKNSIYYSTAKKAFFAVYDRRSSLDLIGSEINADSGEWTNTTSHISGGIDSYFEYMYKAYLLFKDKVYLEGWKKLNGANKKYMYQEVNNYGYLAQVNMHTGQILSTSTGALDAFYSGLLAYSGDIKAARKLQFGNYHLWTKFNIEPEIMDYQMDTIIHPQYILRPENIESCYYLYRATKDRIYLSMASRMINDILTHCRTEDAFTGLADVRTFSKIDYMESFFFAETLKYSFLIFTPDLKMDLTQYVFTTEAHPLKIQ